MLLRQPTPRMGGFLVQGEIPAPRIGEMPMRDQRRVLKTYQPTVAQFDLFRTQGPEPQWRQLPQATRSTVTDLMARLLSEHRRSEGLGAGGERRDD
jgi:hypothetical protein